MRSGILDLDCRGLLGAVIQELGRLDARGQRCLCYAPCQRLSRALIVALRRDGDGVRLDVRTTGLACYGVLCRCYALARRLVGYADGRGLYRTVIREAERINCCYQLALVDVPCQDDWRTLIVALRRDGDVVRAIVGSRPSAIDIIVRTLCQDCAARCILDDDARRLCRSIVCVLVWVEACSQRRLLDLPCQDDLVTSCIIARRYDSDGVRVCLACTLYAARLDGVVCAAHHLPARIVGIADDKRRRMLCAVIRVGGRRSKACRESTSCYLPRQDYRLACIVACRRDGDGIGVWQYRTLYALDGVVCAPRHDLRRRIGILDDYLDALLDAIIGLICRRYELCRQCRCLDSPVQLYGATVVATLCRRDGDGVVADVGPREVSACREVVVKLQLYAGLLVPDGVRRRMCRAVIRDLIRRDCRRHLALAYAPRQVDVVTPGVDAHTIDSDVMGCCKGRTDGSVISIVGPQYEGLAGIGCILDCDGRGLLRAVIDEAVARHVRDTGCQRPLYDLECEGLLCALVCILQVATERDGDCMRAYGLEVAVPRDGVVRPLDEGLRTCHADCRMLYCSRVIDARRTDVRRKAALVLYARRDGARLDAPAQGLRRTCIVALRRHYDLVVADCRSLPDASCRDLIIDALGQRTGRSRRDCQAWVLLAAVIRELVGCYRRRQRCRLYLIRLLVGQRTDSVVRVQHGDLRGHCDLAYLRQVCRRTRTSLVCVSDGVVCSLREALDADCRLLSVCQAVIRDVAYLRVLGCQLYCLNFPRQLDVVTGVVAHRTYGDEVVADVLCRPRATGDNLIVSALYGCRACSCDYQSWVIDYALVVVEGLCRQRRCQRRRYYVEVDNLGVLVVADSMQRDASGPDCYVLAILKREVVADLDVLPDQNWREMMCVRDTTNLRSDLLASVGLILYLRNLGIDDVCPHDVPRQLDWLLPCEVRARSDCYLIPRILVRIHRTRHSIDGVVRRTDGIRRALVICAHGHCVLREVIEERPLVKACRQRGRRDVVRQLAVTTVVARADDIDGVSADIGARCVAVVKGVVGALRQRLACSLVCDYRLRQLHRSIIRPRCPRQCCRKLRLGDVERDCRRTGVVTDSSDVDYRLADVDVVPVAGDDEVDALIDGELLAARCELATERRRPDLLASVTPVGYRERLQAYCSYLEGHGLGRPFDEVARAIRRQRDDTRRRTDIGVLPVCDAVAASILRISLILVTDARRDLAACVRVVCCQPYDVRLVDVDRCDVEVDCASACVVGCLRRQRDGSYPDIDIVAIRRRIVGVRYLPLAIREHRRWLDLAARVLLVVNCCDCDVRTAQVKRQDVERDVQLATVIASSTNDDGRRVTDIGPLGLRVCYGVVCALSQDLTVKRDDYLRHVLDCRNACVHFVLYARHDGILDAPLDDRERDGLLPTEIAGTLVSRYVYLAIVGAVCDVRAIRDGVLARIYCVAAHLQSEALRRDLAASVRVLGIDARDGHILHVSTRDAERHIPAAREVARLAIYGLERCYRTVGDVHVAAVLYLIVRALVHVVVRRSIAEEDVRRRRHRYSSELRRLYLVYLDVAATDVIRVDREVQRLRASKVVDTRDGHGRRTPVDMVAVREDIVCTLDEYVVAILDYEDYVVCGRVLLSVVCDCRYRLIRALDDLHRSYLERYARRVLEVASTERRQGYDALASVDVVAVRDAVVDALDKRVVALAKLRRHDWLDWLAGIRILGLVKRVRDVPDVRLLDGERHCPAVLVRALTSVRDGSDIRADIYVLSVCDGVVRS